MTNITHKRGDTFELSCTVENSGVAVDITNWTITSQARSETDVVLQSFTVTKTVPLNGEFAVRATAAETALWGLGNYQMDIQFVDGSGDVNSTDTFNLSVLRDITRA